MLAEQQQQVKQVQGGMRRQDRLAEERLRRAEDQIASMVEAMQELDHKVLTARPCNFVSSAVQCSIVAVCLLRQPDMLFLPAGQGRAGQGRAGQGRAGQGRAGQGRAGQGRAG